MNVPRRVALEYAILFLGIALLGVSVNVVLTVYQSMRPAEATLSPTSSGVLVTAKLAILLAGPLSFLLFAVHGISVLVRRARR